MKPCCYFFLAWYFTSIPSSSSTCSSSLPRRSYSSGISKGRTVISLFSVFKNKRLFSSCLISSLSDLCANELEAEGPRWPEGSGLCQSETSGGNGLSVKKSNYQRERFVKRMGPTNLISTQRWGSWQWKLRWRRWQAMLEPGRLDVKFSFTDFYKI